MMHGDVNAYLLQEKRPVAHKIDIVSIIHFAADYSYNARQLRQVSDGLHYCMSMVFLETQSLDLN